MAKGDKTEQAGPDPSAAKLKRKNLLIEALSYIGKFKGQVVVIKYGGAAMVHEAIRTTFSQDIVLLQTLGMRPVIVHGGGPEVSRVMETMGHQAQFVEGLRVTSEEGLRITEMVLSGTVNKAIVAGLNRQGGNAVGLSGKDARLITARKMEPVNGVDLGFVGEITRVNPEILTLLLENGHIPVVSPIGLGEDGLTYNINADTAASRVAAALRAQKIILMTDVDGIVDRERLVSTLTVEEARQLISAGVIAGGMLPKVEAVFHSLSQGVVSAHIINGNDHHAIIAELFTDKGIGTQIFS